jgi:glycogen operon protein
VDWRGSGLILLAVMGCSGTGGSGAEESGGTSSTTDTPETISDVTTGTTSPDSSTTDASTSTVGGDSSTGEVTAPEPWTIGVDSARATRIEVWVYAAPDDAQPALTQLLEHDGDTRWEATIDGAALAEAEVETVYYGFRAWGPNWPYAPDWEPGTETGFVADVDADGNRFNPNKLLIDPYALELSHDPQTLEVGGYDVFATGPQWRALDSGQRAPKSIALPMPEPLAPGPQHALSRDVVYEVHVRGLTRNDAAVEEACRGTYAGAATRAESLAALGVTAVEFLPIHETDNEHNDREEGTAGDNYWGYSTLNYFAPDRRYACDKSPGGPTREFREMVEVFHAAGIKVYLDVVYNHTAETGTWGVADTAAIFSLRGLDNATYYELTEDGLGYVDNSGVGANLDVTQPLARQLVMESLRYAHEQLGVDGFRFDLASVLGNQCSVGCFEFGHAGLLTEIADAFARPDEGGPGVDLLAEPWGIGPGTYQIGNFPQGWAEWNGQFRDTLRRDLNRIDSESVTPRDLLTRMRGSPDLYGDDERPAASLNFVVAHDGFTLNDLFRCNEKDNEQRWPFGPSDGGSDQNYGLDWGADSRRLARTSVAWLMTASGTPMLRGGDEYLRTTRCNNNPYNLDSIGTWLDWEAVEDEQAFSEFLASMAAFRGRHPTLTDQRNFFGAARWLDTLGNDVDDAYLNQPSLHFLAMLLPGADLEGETAAAIYFGYNGWTDDLTATLPSAPDGTQWYLVVDTASELPAAAPGAQTVIEGSTLSVADRAVVIAVAR